MRVEVREYREEDHPAVVALYHLSRPLGTSPPEAVSSREYRLAAINSSGEIIGYGMASDGEVSNIQVFVHPEFQRRRVGSALWEQLDRHLRNASASEVQAWVREENSAGVAWLKALGFTQTRL
ncbi:MAG: GNAT family N-acetyltransferase, partial [Chloroflexi bacterium]|nr:GNAT family N-acetyltransferase [Chloroflexota bacterium]